MAIRLNTAGRVATIEIDNPPLNFIGCTEREGLRDAFDKALRADIDRIIVTGIGRAFAAGGDAKEFDHPLREPHLNEILKQVADAKIPVIAAINGIALGGGLEIALACRYRVASPNAEMGLPEVTLGVIPGAGGTQRLPRLIGVGEAVEMISQGKVVSAQRALDIGLIDAISDDPVSTARGLSDDVLSGAIVPDFRRTPVTDDAALATARANIEKKFRGQIAPLRAIELVEASARKELEENLRDERETFIELRASSQGRALRHVFFAERFASSQSRSFPRPNGSVSSAIVVGGGNMGAGIAYDLILHEIDVTIIENDDAGIKRATANFEKLLDQGVERGTVSASRSEEIFSRMRVAVGFENLPKAQIVIEAAFEDASVKAAIFDRLQHNLPESTVLATNTSYLDVNLLAKGIRNPSRFLGLHFFSRAQVMKLVEIVRGEQTSEFALGVGYALASKLGKIPVLSGVCDGFIGNRILTRYRLAADLIVLGGAFPSSVDAAMREFGMAMGPYAAQDMSGLDIAYANRQRQNLSRRDDVRYVPIVDSLVEEHHRLGVKSGSGWYDYTDSGQREDSPVVKETIRRASADAGITRRSFSQKEISERLILAMISEAADILDEKIASSPSDIDVVMIHGYGFPRWRGGLLHYADSVGLKSILQKLRALAAIDQLAWPVPKLLEHLVETGMNFSALGR